jgi:hypothetical protein
MDLKGGKKESIVTTDVCTVVNSTCSSIGLNKELNLITLKRLAMDIQPFISGLLIILIKLVFVRIVVRTQILILKRRKEKDQEPSGLILVEDT